MSLNGVSNNYTPTMPPMLNTPPMQPLDSQCQLGQNKIDDEENTDISPVPKRRKWVPIKDHGLPEEENELFQAMINHLEKKDLTTALEKKREMGADGSFVRIADFEIEDYCNIEFEKGVDALVEENYEAAEAILKIFSPKKFDKDASFQNYISLVTNKLSLVKKKELAKADVTELAALTQAYLVIKVLLKASKQLPVERWKLERIEASLRKKIENLNSSLQEFIEAFIQNIDLNTDTFNFLITINQVFKTIGKNNKQASDTALTSEIEQVCITVKNHVHSSVFAYLEDFIKRNYLLLSLGEIEEIAFFPQILASANSKLSDGMWEKAIKYVEKIPEDSEFYTEAQSVKIKATIQAMQCHHAKKEFEKAIEYAERIPKDSEFYAEAQNVRNHPIDALIQKMQDHCEKKEFGKAIACVEGIPQNSQFYSQLKDLKNYAMNELFTALLAHCEKEEFEQVLASAENFPKNSELYPRVEELRRYATITLFNRILGHCAKKESEKAIEYAEKFPKNSELYPQVEGLKNQAIDLLFQEIMNHYRKKELEQVIARAEKFPKSNNFYLRVEGLSIQIMSQLVQKFYQEKNYVKVITYAEKMPQDSRLYAKAENLRNLAFAFVQKELSLFLKAKDHEQAIAYANEVLSTNIKGLHPLAENLKASALFKKGERFYQDGRNKEAIECFKKIPQNQEPFSSRAQNAIIAIERELAQKK